MERRKTDSGGSTPTSAGVRVLIVDDDEPYRVYLRTLVRRLGCVAETACDGAEALQRLGEETFDLLLSDLEMPKLDGLDLITHVRAHPTASEIYAVMITSREDAKSRVAALTLGYDDFLPKSCADLEVKVRIGSAKRLLARQRLADAEMARWRTIASCDELTGVATRRAFLERSRECLVEGQPVALAIFDLDDFKRVNDTWGHLTGDRILHDIGSLFLNRTRRDDLIARYGGDEFVLLVCGASPGEVEPIVGRLSDDLGKLRWYAGTDTVRVSATTGIAYAHLLESPDVDQLLDAADRDLYARKGRKKAQPHVPLPRRSLSS